MSFNPVVPAATEPAFELPSIVVMLAAAGVFGLVVLVDAPRFPASAAAWAAVLAIALYGRNTDDFGADLAAAFGGARGRTDVPTIVDWYMDGKIEIDPMITHVLTLDEINKGFDLMHAGESIRSVVVY